MGDLRRPNGLNKRAEASRVRGEWRKKPQVVWDFSECKHPDNKWQEMRPVSRKKPDCGAWVYFVKDLGLDPVYILYILQDSN